MAKSSFRANLSDILARLNFARSFNQRFDGQRDYNQLFGYKTQLTHQDLFAKFTRQGLARRIVCSYPDAVWSTPPRVISDDETWNKGWNDIVVRHNLYQTLCKLDKLACMSSYAALYIGFDDGKKPIEPLEDGSASAVLYLQPYKAESISIHSLNTDPSHPRYMLPELYKIAPLENTSSAIGTSTVVTNKPEMFVHASRIVHVAQNTLENPILGSPILENVFNLLDDILKVSGGTSEMFWLSANRGMHINVDKDTDMSAEDEEALTDEITEYQHQLRRFIRTRGVDVKNIGSDTIDPSSVFNVLIAEISSATGIPQRVLMGAEAGQLASAQDRANWADRVLENRMLYAEPIILRPLIATLTRSGVLKIPKALKVIIEWPEAFHMSPLERAQAGAQRARSATNMSKALTQTPNLLTVDEARSFIELQQSVPVFDDVGDLGIGT